MPIVPPPKKVQRASGSLNGKQGGPAVPAGGKLENPPHPSSAPSAYVNGGSLPSMPKYGSGAGGPYQPTNQPQSTRSKAGPLK